MKKVLYVDNNNNFYLYLKMAKISNDDWHFLLFDKKKAKLLENNRIKYSLFNCFEKYTPYSLDTGLVSRVITADRILKFYPYLKAKKLLEAQASFFHEVLKKEKPELVLGEVSWANEFVFFQVSSDCNIKYRKLLNLPLRENRVVAFDSEHSFKSIDEQKNLEVREAYTVDYQDLISGLQKHNLHHNGFRKGLSRLLDINAQLNDYRLNQVYWKLRRGIKNLYSIYTRNFIDNNNIKIESLDYIGETKKIIYLSLHIQPEATPDFVSIENSDQLDLIEKISETLEYDEILVVKDHPVNISIRNIKKLKSLYKKNNVLFLDRATKASDIINKASLVCSVAGTVSLEAIDLNKPAIVFSNIFYNKSKFIESVDNMNDFSFTKDKLLSSGIKVYNDLFLEGYGVCAFIHDPEIFPSVLGDTNINMLVDLVDVL
ncbi:hypothetical protein [Vibrio splendidus]|uniref:hypothetical protein n=3 Tax=Vibrio splendidus TaxID=29497 RepID=UPI0039A49A3D